MSVPRDVGTEAHLAAEKHLEAIAEAEERLEEGGNADDHPAIGPYCGCPTCDIREILHAAWPVFLEAAKAAVPCICDPAYKNRGMEDPDCQHHDLVRELEAS